jgi:hypothetical protein
MVKSPSFLKNCVTWVSGRGIDPPSQLVTFKKSNSTSGHDRQSGFVRGWRFLPFEGVAGVLTRTDQEGLVCDAVDRLAQCRNVDIFDMELACLWPVTIEGKVNNKSLKPQKESYSHSQK